MPILASKLGVLATYNYGIDAILFQIWLQLMKDLVKKLESSERKGKCLN